MSKDTKWGQLTPEQLEVQCEDLQTYINTKPDKKYGRVQLFEDGVLVEDVSPPMPRGR